MAVQAVVAARMEQLPLPEVAHLAKEISVVQPIRHVVQLAVAAVQVARVEPALETQAVLPVAEFPTASLVQQCSMQLVARAKAIQLKVLPDLPAELRSAQMPRRGLVPVVVAAEDLFPLGLPLATAPAEL
jgi:hypothetical protein